MAKRKYKKNRAKARSSYETYSAYYDKVTKKNPSMYTKKYNEEEFRKQWLNAKDAGIKNPSITIVRSQRKWDYQFSRRYESLTGRKLTGREMTESELKAYKKTKEYEILTEAQKEELAITRESIFINFVEDEFAGDYEAGRAFFENVMY